MQRGSHCGSKHGKPCKKRRIRPGTEGLAANATRVLRRLRWSWESAVEVKTREGEKTMSPSAQKAIGTTRSGKRQENGGFARQPPGKQPETLEKIDIQMSTRLLRERSLTSIQKGQLRAIVAGAVHTCARMWARGTVVTGLCPACGHEVEVQSRAVRPIPGEGPSARECGRNAPDVQRHVVGSERWPNPGVGKEQQEQ